MDYFVTNQKAHQVFHETPARFSWMPEEYSQGYSLEIFTTHDELYQTYQGIEYSFFTPDQLMEPGSYWYRVWAGKNILVEHQSFEIAPGARSTPLPGRENRYPANLSHPRLWLNQQDIQVVKTSHQSHLAETWTNFIEQGVEPFLDKPPITEPEFYPNHVRKIDLWRGMYITCQEVVYTVKHCAIAWQITGNETYLTKAKSCLLSIADWNLEGPTSRAYNDEAGFRVLVALSWGYDWLYPALTDDEKQKVKHALLQRGRELFHYVSEEIKIHVKLMDSHGVRSLSMALIPAALAIYREEQEATQWLNYVIEYLYTIYTPWGGEDGGWAEGPSYWQSGLSFVTEAMVLLRKAFSLNLHERPFFQHTGDFPLYTYSQDMRFMGFCDMSDQGEYPGPKVGYILRILSVLSQSPNRHFYAWYYEEAKKSVQEQQGTFFNYGWWNFAFEELFFQTQFEPIKSLPPTPGVQVAWFRDVDWVCIHKDIANPEEHLGFMFKSSPYGSVSHSHGDQNAFVLHAYGEPLAIQAGYYIGFWSDMHVHFRRHTLSKNGILIDGKGQFAEIYKASGTEDRNPSAKSQFEKLVQSNGKIEACEQFDTWTYCRGNATPAYQHHVPYLNNYTRQVLFYHDGFFLIIDQVDLSQKAKVHWLLHSLSQMELKDQQVVVSQGKVLLDVHFLNTAMNLSQTKEFQGVDPKEVEAYPPQWHLNAETVQEAQSHEIITLLHPYKSVNPRVLLVNEVQNNLISLGFHDKQISILKQPNGFWTIEDYQQ